MNYCRTIQKRFLYIDVCTQKYILLFTQMGFVREATNGIFLLRRPPHPPQCAHWGTFSSRRRLGGRCRTARQTEIRRRAIRESPLQGIESGVPNGVTNSAGLKSRSVSGHGPHGNLKFYKRRKRPARRALDIHFIRGLIF